MFGIQLYNWNNGMSELGAMHPSHYSMISASYCILSRLGKVLIVDEGDLAELVETAETLDFSFAV